MTERIGQRTLRFDQAPRILSHAAAVGKKEGAGPLGAQFDFVAPDDRMGQKSWELAESELQKTAIRTALQKGGLSRDDLDLVLAGDLLNQCTGSFLASMQSDVPYLGQYGACSTMAQGLALGACLLAGGAARRLLAAASSHFCSAERQYRFPLAYGGQRTPTAQWTATAAGAAVLAAGQPRRKSAPQGAEAVLAAGQPRRKSAPQGAGAVLAAGQPRRKSAPQGAGAVLAAGQPCRKSAPQGAGAVLAAGQPRRKSAPQGAETAAGRSGQDAADGDLLITHALFGKMVEMGVTDANNMGAAMAPAAYDTLSTLLADLGAQPRDFDCIVTGDLGHVGADILLTLLREDGIDLSPVYSDCGSLLFGEKQDAHAGGSGCGCSAAVLCGPLLRDMHAGKIRRLVFAGTGAMMSPTSVQQGQPIAGICHAVVIERSGA